MTQPDQAGPATPDPRTRRPVVIGPRQGESLLVGPVEHLFKLTGELTGGALAVEEFSLPAGAMGARPHVHENHDEYFWVLEGVVTMHDGESETDAVEGTLVAATRGAPHGYRNASGDPARGLCLFTPAGYEGYFREVHTALESGADASEEFLASVRRRYGSWSWPPTP